MINQTNLRQAKNRQTSNRYTSNRPVEWLRVNLFNPTASVIQLMMPDGTRTTVPSNGGVLLFSKPVKIKLGNGGWQPYKASLLEDL